MFNPKIIVLTPVKNESWILSRFLTVTSLFADHIIIADQYSTDDSKAISASFPKVHLIENSNRNYDEESRQMLLINKARELYGPNNILLALDADEILSADSLVSNEWDLIRRAAPGTIFCFEKPTYYNGLHKAIRYRSFEGWPLGFVDDGSVHQSTVIHGNRLPVSKTSERIIFKEIRFLHFVLLLPNRQRAKCRYYCLLETINHHRPWRARQLLYSHFHDFSKQGDGIHDADPAWLERWNEAGIRFDNFDDSGPFWFDAAAVGLIQSNKSVRIWWEDIWDPGFKNLVKNNAGSGIRCPPLAVDFVRNMLVRLLFTVYGLKSRLTKLGR